MSPAWNINDPVRNAAPNLIHYCCYSVGRPKFWHCIKIMTLVQYVILRKDLQTVLNWPLGALFAQVCHASTAVLHLHKDDPNTKNYLAELDSMHKVVLQAPDEKSLTGLAEKLTESKIDFKLWIEQPENIPTCIAVKPYPKNDIKGLVQRFKLYS